MDDILSPAEAAAALDISERTLRLWRARGLIEPVMITPDRPRYRRSDLDNVQRPAMGPPVKSGKYVGWRKKGQA